MVVLVKHSLTSITNFWGKSCKISATFQLWSLILNLFFKIKALQHKCNRSVSYIEALLYTHPAKPWHQQGSSLTHLPLGEGECERQTEGGGQECSMEWNSSVVMLTLLWVNYHTDRLITHSDRGVEEQAYSLRFKHNASVGVCENQTADWNVREEKPLHQY